MSRNGLVQTALWRLLITTLFFLPLDNKQIIGSPNKCLTFFLPYRKPLLILKLFALTQFSKISLLIRDYLFCANNVFLVFSPSRREEVHGEAQRVLRTFPGKNEKESSGKQMPSFPEMVHYIQDKVQCFCHSK